MMKYKIGLKVKTKMDTINHPSGNQSFFYHWWNITTIAEDHMVLTDNLGNIMVTDEHGNGLCPKQGHYIYKIKN